MAGDDQRDVVAARDRREVQRRTIPAKGAEHDRPIGAQSEDAPRGLAAEPRSAGRERSVTHDGAHGAEPAREGQAQCQGGRGVSPADDVERLAGLDAERVVVLVDPVPREIRERDARHARARRRREGERRDVSDHRGRFQLAQDLRLAVGARIEVRVEFARLPNRGLHVDRQAVDLHHPGVGVAGLQFESPANRLLEKPLRHAAADHDPRIRPCAQDFVDDFGIARRVAETVAGNVEDEEHRAMRQSLGSGLQAPGSFFTRAESVCKLKTSSLKPEA